MKSITREEWVRRYAARVVERAGWTPEEAAEAARAGADLHAADTAPHVEAEWADDPPLTPEAEADEEMSYWTDDGEG